MVEWHGNNGNWAYKCDFVGQDLAQVEDVERGRDCIENCRNTNGCTHYTLNKERRICFMKKGSVRANDYFYSGNDNHICGYL